MVDACEEYEKRLRPYLGVARVALALCLLPFQTPAPSGTMNSALGSFPLVGSFRPKALSGFQLWTPPGSPVLLNLPSNEAGPLALADR